MIRIHCSYIKNKLPVTTARQFYAYLIYGSTLRKTASQRTSIRMIGTCIKRKGTHYRFYKKKMNRKNEKSKERKRQKEIQMDGEIKIQTERQAEDRQTDKVKLHCV